jgi:hypothetical protein
MILGTILKFSNVGKIIFAIVLILSTNSHAQFLQEFKWTNDTASSTILVGDFNGDGTSDLLYYSPLNGIANWKLMTSDGEGSFNTAYYCAPGQGINNGVWAGDFNGDGVCDKISQVYSSDTAFGGWWVNLSKQEQYSFSFNFNYPNGISSRWTKELGNSDPSKNLIGDFNGDGISDIAYQQQSGSDWIVMFGTGVSFKKGILFSTDTFQSNFNKVFTGDFNGDGYADKLRLISKGSNKGWYVDISTGISFTTCNIPWSTEIPPDPSKVLIGDFDGDGKADILYFQVDPNNSNQGDWIFMKCTGSNFIKGRLWANGQDPNNGFWAGDFNGDGWCDKLTRVASGKMAGFWEANITNTTSPKVGVWYEPLHYNYIDHGIQNSNWGMRNSVTGERGKDSLKSPVVGWGSDEIRDTLYSSQDSSIVRRQIQAMKKAGIDFILVDITNGFTEKNSTYGSYNYDVTPSYPGYNADISAGKGARALFDKMYHMPSDQQINIALGLGFEFWGPTSLCYDWSNWDSWSNQNLRLSNAISYLDSNYMHNNKYSSLYFNYLGKPLIVAYLDKGDDYPQLSDADRTTIIPRKRFPSLTVKDAVTWMNTFGTNDDIVKAGKCIPLSKRFVPGITQKRYWGYGNGAVDGSPNSNTPIPKNSEIMSIMPGYWKWNVKSEGKLIDRQNGNYYINQWLQVLNVMPRMVLICAWNEWAEESAIEGCEGANGWKDYYGNNQYDWYLQITQSYTYIFKNNILPSGIYIRENSQKNIYLWNGNSFIYQGVLPHGNPVIILPEGWLANHNYNISKYSN